MAIALFFRDAGKATMPAISTMAASTPLHPASIETANPVVASRSTRPCAMTVSSKGSTTAVLIVASMPVNG